MAQYEVIIGMEIHAELATRTKMFCSCLNAAFESAPNTNICPVCLALPGSLPVLNQQAIEWTVDLGYDLGATVAEFTKWDRKNYFYPDIPKGYQISQYDLPLLVGGAIEFTDAEGATKRIALTRVHLEEDTGKLMHEADGSTLVDYNRAGVPLIELVSEPELRSADDAKRFCQTYQFILQRRGIARADMEKGELRCEANISVRPVGQSEFGTKVEVKNLNSFRAMERAIEYEVDRQIKALEQGEALVQETRGWDEAKQQTYVQRRKETAADYRYFPEPDLPPVTPPALWDLSTKERTGLPYPHEVVAELKHTYALPEAVAAFVTSDARAYAMWTELVQELAEPDETQKEQLRIAASTYANIDRARELSAPQLLELSELVANSTISKSQIRAVIDATIERQADPKAVVAALGLGQVSDSNAITAAIDRVLAANQDVVAKYQAGETAVFGFLVGQAMRELKGQGNPGMVNQILKKKLGGS